MYFNKMRKNQKQKWRGLQILLVVLFLLMGCSGGSQGQQTSSVKESVESVDLSDAGQTSPDAVLQSTQTEAAEEPLPSPVELTLLHDLDETRAEILRGLTESFNQLNTEGITVEILRQPEVFLRLTSPQSALEEGEESQETASIVLPDLLIADVGFLNSGADMTQPIDSFLTEQAEQLKQYREVLFDASAVTGVVRGLPFSLRGDVMFFNDSVLSESATALPTDLASFMQAGEAVMEKRRIPLLGICMGQDTETAFLDEVLRCFGSSLTESVAASGEVQIGFDTKEGEEAVDALLKLYRTGYIRTYSSHERMRQDFLKGAICAYWGSGTDLTYLDAERFSVTPSLLVLGNQKASAISLKDVFLLTDDDKKQQAANAFMAYLASENTATLWAVGTGDLPVTTATFDFKEYRSKMETDVVSYLMTDENVDFFIADSSEEAALIRDELKQRLMMHAEDEVTAQELIDEIKSVYATR